VESRKRGGRTKGTPNKVTAQVKEKLTEVLTKELEQLELDGLTAKDRIELVKAILPYILPRLQATYLEHEKDPTGRITDIILIDWI